MRCPVCDQLNHELTIECEAEATTTLQLRYSMAPLPQQEGADHHKDQEQWEIVLASRKRRMKIASSIQQHRTLAHSA